MHVYKLVIPRENIKLNTKLQSTNQLISYSVHEQSYKKQSVVYTKFFICVFLPSFAPSFLLPYDLHYDFDNML